MSKHLTAPITVQDIEDIQVGDYIYYSGILATGRDDVHHRVVHLGMECPVDLRGMALFHAGPIVRETPGHNEIICAGPTSSIRMEQEEAEFIEITGVKVIIGKGAMGEKTAKACQEYKTIHCVFPGGCGVKAASCVEELIDVKWRDLGIPEALWVMRVKDFGPLVVTIDTKGNNLFKENAAYYASKRDAAILPIKEKLKHYMG